MEFWRTTAVRASALVVERAGECYIFITSGAKSEPMPVISPGYDPDSGYFGRALFHINAGIQARLEYRTKLAETWG
jgi:hypothetical protein